LEDADRREEEEEEEDMGSAYFSHVQERINR
jgi:hypothetical protein